MTNDLEHAERRRSLEEFANSSGQPNQPMPTGHALVRPTASLTPMGAQPVAAYRDEAKVLQKLSALAAAAGSDWFYRFPAKNQDGSTAWIEGPSVKLANSVARIFGNCVIEMREVDVGDCFVFYARFSDLETGFSLERAYRQRKGQRTFKSKDAERQLDILYQIGVSKATRNVIVNSLQLYCDFAFEAARNSLTDKIGKDIAGWRDRTVEGLARIPVELRRVERVMGRASKDWLAPDIARIVAMMHTIADGMASVDDTFPPDQTIIEKAPPAPATADPPGAAAPASPVVAVEEPRASSSEAAPPAASNVNAAAPKNFAEYQQLVEATCAAAADANELMKWFRSEPQRRLRNGAGLVAEETAAAKVLVDARVKALQQQT